MTETMLVSVSEAARRLHIDYRLAQELVRTGELASKRIGKRDKVPVQAIERYVESASDLLSVRDAARKIGIGVDAAHKLVQSGELASVAATPGGRIRKVPVQALYEYVGKGAV